MGSKLSGLEAKLDAMKADTPPIRMFKRGVELLSPEHSETPYYIPDTDPIEYVLPTDTLELAEEVLRLRQYKQLASAYSDAVSEYVKEVELELHKAMSTKGPVGFTTKSGFRFAMTSQSQAKARPELGGTSNPALKQWLIDNDMPQIAAGSINATSLKSAVSRWMELYPIEAFVQEGDDMRELHGDELLQALHLEDTVDAEGNTVTAQQQLEARIAEHERLEELMEIAKIPAISVTAV